MEAVMNEIAVERYPFYKDSGIEWLGDIPEHWEIKPGLNILFEAKEKNIGMKRNTVLSLSYGNIRVKGEEELTGLVPESFETYQLVNKGDIIFRPTDLQNDHVSLRSGLSEYEGIITSAYINLRLKPNINTKFYSYFFRAIDNNKTIYSLGSGLRQNIDFRDFRRFTFPFPPLQEQTAIANFLDHKTAQIDQAIRIKEKQIELLKERRQILIHRAVTRGLNPDVKMKDSGVEWIGDIPEHWEVVGLRRLFTNLNNRRIPIEAEERGKKKGQFPYYGASGIIDYVDDYLFNEPLILIAEDGANLLSKSTPLAFIATGKYWVNNHAHIIKPNRPGFVFWAELLSSLDYTPLITGAAQPKLTKDRLASIKLPVPPDDELVKISTYLDFISMKVATAIGVKIKEIEKLKEYKASLINSAVTGKIKVS